MTNIIIVSENKPPSDGPKYIEVSDTCGYVVRDIASTISKPKTAKRDSQVTNLDG